MKARVLLATLALCACKAEGDQATRALPAPEPPADAAGTPVEAVAPPAATERVRERSAREVAEPTPARNGSPPNAAEPAATASSPPPAGDASCQQTCQTGLQTCIAQQPPDPDGGAGLEGLARCKKALDECKARCSP
ncbi:MAG TPA: hypothetical protein VGP93_01550 [Polyangiaceae bacterium]|jgi:hypothetical protein|nr:hypothetical protein [Polyangiaceae bacterium]